MVKGLLEGKAPDQVRGDKAGGWKMYDVRCMVYDVRHSDFDTLR